MLHSLLIKDRWTDRQTGRQLVGTPFLHGTAFRHGMAFRNGTTKNPGFVERNWNGTKKLNTGTELERNEINGRNDYLERNGNLKGRSNGLPTPYSYWSSQR